MKVLIVGYGSMGKRRHAVIQQLRPTWEIVIYDPLAVAGTTMDKDADLVIIASPHTRHKDAITWCSYIREKAIPCLIEKPLGMLQLPAYYSSESIVGFNYRFHRQWEEIAQHAASGFLCFIANEQLYKKYGPTVVETSGSHAFDIALRLLGPTTSVDIVSDGVCMRGEIIHENGMSVYHYNMNARERLVLIGNKRTAMDLERDDECYLREMGAWIRLLETGERDERLASLEDGLMVEKIIAQAQERA